MKLLSILLCLPLLAGCTVLQKITHGQNKIDKTVTKLNTTQEERLGEIGKFAVATDLALDITNKDTAVDVAKKTNDRVLNLADKPTLEDFKVMQRMVAQLQTNNESLLKKEDAKVADLQEQVKDLNDKLKQATDAQLKAAEKNAAELEQYKGWFGLKAVFMGLKRFSLWLIAFVILFLILRVAAMFNPIASSIFSVFDGIGSIAIHGIKALAPKAVATAGFVGKSSADALSKIVDTIQTSKTKQEASGKPINLQDILNDLEKNMGDQDKKVVQAAKTSLGYT